MKFQLSIFRFISAKMKNHKAGREEEAERRETTEFSHGVRRE